MKNASKKTKKWLEILALTALFIKLANFLFKNKKKVEKFECNLIDFAKQEENEVKQLIEGEEDFNKFCSDSSSIFKDYFIPHDGNGHRPKILRTKSLLFIVLIALLVKISVTGYLFFIYPNQAKMSEEMTFKLLELINKDRQDNNINALSVNPVLTNAALAKAQDMLAQNYFNHYGPGGKKPWDWIDRSAYSYVYAGENLAMNFMSADNVHTALMQSPTHRKNILNDKYEDLGLAVLVGKIDGQETDILVELFASQNEKKPALEQAQTADNLAKAPALSEITEASATAEIAPAGALESENQSLPDKQQGGSAPAEAGNISSATEVASAENQRLNPNPDLEKTTASAITYIGIPKESKINLAQKLIIYSKYFYLALLSLMIIVLLINIFVRLEIQHKPVIIQSLLVILFISGLIFARLHLLENIYNTIAII